MQKRTNIAISVAAVILLVLTVCGSVWDFEIAKALYLGEMPSENMFGIIFSYIGIIPTFVGWSFLGASIFYLSKKQIDSTRKRRWLMALAVLLFVLSFFFYCNTVFYPFVYFRSFLAVTITTRHTRPINLTVFFLFSLLCV